MEKSCVLSEADDNLINATNQRNSTKLYVPEVILLINNIIFLKKLEASIQKNSFLEYRSEIITKAKNNSLDYMIDPTFRNISRLFVLSLKKVTLILCKILLLSIIYY